MELPGKSLPKSEYYTEGVAEYVMVLFPGEFKGICVDVGAYDPMWLSNSWILEQAGWEVHCIEPNPKCIPQLKKLRKYVYECACGEHNEDNVELFVYYNDTAGEAAGTGLIKHTDPYAEKIFSHTLTTNVRTLDWLMENEIKRDHIDYLSIDVEHNEMAVLRGTDLGRWKPKVIVIESLSDSEKAEQREWLKERMYRLVHRIVYNDIYIREDYYNSCLFLDQGVKTFRHSNPAYHPAIA